MRSTVGLEAGPEDQLSPSLSAQDWS